MARAGDDNGGAEPRRRRERSKSREESEAEKSTSSITRIGNRHHVPLDGGAMSIGGAGILGGRGVDRSGESTSVRPDILRRALSF